MISLKGKIMDGKYVYDNPHYKTKFDEFKKNNEGKDFEITISKISRATHEHHELYRGVLLPSVAQYLSEPDIEKVHILIKQKFLRYDIPDNDLNQIPEKHTDRIKFIQNSDMTINSYLRSTATLSGKEFKEFNDRVNDWIIHDLQYRIENQNLPEKLKDQFNGEEINERK